MNETKQKNLAKILKNKPNGFCLYSPAFGKLVLKGVEERNGWQSIVTERVEAPTLQVCFSEYGFLNKDISDGECMLFPSKDEKDWAKYAYDDRKDLEYESVVMCQRKGEKGTWHVEYYSCFGATIGKTVPPEVDYDENGVGAAPCVVTKELDSDWEHIVPLDKFKPNCRWWKPSPEDDYAQR